MCDVELLIEVIRRYDYLWNLGHPDYKNRKKKAECWTKISKETGIGIEECKRKWKGLRDSFSRENSKKYTSGQEAGEPQERWRYYNNLLFLKEHMKPRVTICNYTVSEIGLEEGETSVSISMNDGENLITEACSSTPSLQVEGGEDGESVLFEQYSGESTTTRSLSTRRKRICDTAIEKKLIETITSVNSYIRSTGDSDEDEDTLFCKALTKKIKKFPLRKKNELKVKLLQFMNKEEEDFFPTVD